ncbi:SNARE protein, putative [Plasmodium berghei]|uniref:SNARE protein, putative n=2 Tax=Plasmodium berghei TaxID=5821 RepID=A0A509AGK7_PLABA|nr:SNARE protein, putative [Plasmodium berghei ANKA]CXI17125.1 SNARE protein, putative [Plasmodium berghei]SCM19676.1 SNARE protein, putative [Plasmodium berghei]SCN23419.1 SNARE protein, putative [Plasmodium berghei]SCO59073.1 SNARE protein, putative [Plasmodium berghei]SCO59701.1 SNARE protein, putative [Plasmodium berghei]|eukprot:XP_034420586.1 SNARE protein, putative [Plasmodium berghei ANKA]
MSYKNHLSGNTTYIEDEHVGNTEKKIKDNILLIKKNMIYAEENLENLKNNLISKRIIESLHEEIHQIYVKVIETENLFHDWEIKFSENPFEKQQKKYIFEKLNIHFKNEVNKLENISLNVKRAANELPNIENGEMRQSLNSIKKKNSQKANSNGNNNYYNSSSFISSEFGDDNFILNLDKTYENNDEFIESSNFYDYELDQFNENDLLIESEIANDRYEGIKKIQGQVAQAQEVFKDLANLVFSQKETLNSLNNNIYETNVNTFNSTKELKKTYNNVKHQRISWCLAFITIGIFIYFIYFKLMHITLFG